MRFGLAACVLLLAPGVFAQEWVAPPLPVEILPAEPVADPVIDPCRNPRAYPHDSRWFDRAQGFFSERTCEPAIWFDRFFGHERSGDVASALVRVIPSVQYSHRDFTDAGIRLQARLNLPNLRNRFSVVVNDDADEQDGLLQGETQRPQRANAANREASAALRYLVHLADQSGADVDIGLRGQAKFFTRARYYRTWSHTPVLDSRFTQSAFFLDGEGFGEASRYEVERMLSDDVMLRWSTQATVSEKVNGLELRDGIQLLHQIDRNRAINFNLAMTVDSDPAWKANRYESSVRYRQRAFRPWFFFEVEPFVDAIRADNFRLNPGVAFRIEFWLGDAGDDSGIEHIGRATAAPLPLDPAPGDAPALTSPNDARPAGVP